MTVRHLIEELSKLPADLPVFIADWSEGYMADREMEGATSVNVVGETPETKRCPTLPCRVVLTP